MIQQADGEWLEWYSQLHALILSQALPPHARRYVVWSCAPLSQSTQSTSLCAGLANRFLGMVTAFAYALATRRALLIHCSPPPSACLQDYLFSSHFDWSHRLPEEEGAGGMLELDARGHHRPLLEHELRHFNLASEHPHKVVRLTVLESFLPHLLANPSVGRELGALGFTSPDALFSRLARILFRPTPPLLAALRPFAQPDNADEPPPVTLAIQVRLGATGGGARGQVGLGLGELPRFRAAADRISQRVSRSDPYRSVAWVLAADSLKVVETVFREEWNGGHVRWHNHSSSLALALARSSAADASSSTPLAELEIGSVEDSGEGHVLLGSLIDFFALALSDHALVSVPSTFGFTARLFNLTGSTALHAIFRQDWKQIAERHYHAVLPDHHQVESSRVFGADLCSTVGWAGDLCIRYAP